MTIRNKPRDAAVFGVDLGKNLFHVCGLDAAGAPIQRATFRRDTLLQFFERATPTIVGMEACPGSQWLARKLQTMGHTVRIVPAKFVKPYVKSNKNDLIDAEAIAEAVSRPTMRFVEVRSPSRSTCKPCTGCEIVLSPSGPGSSARCGLSASSTESRCIRAPAGSKPTFLGCSPMKRTI